MRKIIFSLLLIGFITTIFSQNFVGENSKTITNSKIVGLIPVRNEEILIEQCLRALACYTDAIVVLDDGSIDRTVEIVETLKDELHIERIIINKESAWLNQSESVNKQKMLIAGREIGGTHFITIDADEMFSAYCKKDNWLRKKILNLKKGEVLTFPMVHFWDGLNYYRDDEGMSPSSVRWRGVTGVFCDDGTSDYSINININSATIHVGRVPANLKNKKILSIDNLDYNIIHFKCVNLENIKIKRVWYMCLEFLAANKQKPTQVENNAAKINKFYIDKSSGHGFANEKIFNTQIILKEVDPHWLNGYLFFQKPDFRELGIHKKKEVVQWFNDYGFEYFSLLNIWEEPWVKELLSKTIKHEEVSFVVIIPSYNNAQWYEKNLSSVLNQNYSKYRVIYIDDCSPDHTGNFVEDYLKHYDLDNRVVLIKNMERRGALSNYYHAIWLCDPKEIIVTVDGDDWLENNDVLSTLSTVYSDSNLWITYGQFRYYPSNKKGFCKEYSSEIINQNSFREFGFLASHLRTFYAGLFQKILKNDFIDEDGNFFPMAWDLAFMFPMLEMARDGHIKCIDQILYVYNRANVINDDKVNHDLQKYLGWEAIRKRPKYKRLASLFTE